MSRSLMKRKSLYEILLDALDICIEKFQFLLLSEKRMDHRLKYKAKIVKLTEENRRQPV